MTRCGIGVIGLVGCVLVAAPAAAQGMTPFFGQATGHLGVANGTDGRGSTLSLGASVAMVAASGWGAELDVGFADDDNGETGGLDVQSYMLNVVGMWRTGRVRPFVAVGGGVIRARTCTPACAGTLAWTDWGVSAGGGVLYRLNALAGLRGDVRYLAAPGDHPDPLRPDSFGLWRVTVGATFLWNED